MTFIAVVIALSYLSLVVELVVFPVPSVASAGQMAVQKGRSLLGRIVHAIRGLAVGGLLFLPLILVLLPVLQQWSLPLVEAVPLWWQALAVIPIFCGRGLSFFAALRMRGSLQLFQGEEPAALITTGPFRLSRNPILVGMLLTYAGILMLLPHTLLLAGFVFIAWHMHGKVRLEELHLGSTHGKQFLDYCARTRRYL